ncbi:hypothetical protein TNCV_3077951 [Trichonephila clavipes]|nr:hypothetical protein TNCV_3077951 [Trichonephila clavipes]
MSTRPNPSIRTSLFFGVLVSKLHSEAIRGLFATDLAILRHDQVARATVELALNSPSYYPMPTRGLKTRISSPKR